MSPCRSMSSIYGWRRFGHIGLAVAVILTVLQRLAKVGDLMSGKVSSSQTSERVRMLLCVSSVHAHKVDARRGPIGAEQDAFPGP